MFITKKKMQDRIAEEVNKALCERDRDAWVQRSMEDRDRVVDRRIERINQRLLDLEKKNFPERFERTYCPMEVRDLQSC